MPSASLIKEFEQLVGKENVFSSEADRQSYAYDAAVLKPMIPSLVVRPTEVEQLGQVVKRCYEEGIPMTVRGSGTNLTGGTIPDCSDTIVILTTGLNKILEINTEDLYATVQPGVITAKFAAAHAIADLVTPEKLSPDYIIPPATDPDVAPAVAAATARAAIESGIARNPVDPQSVAENLRKRLS